MARKWRCPMDSNKVFSLWGMWRYKIWGSHQNLGIGNASRPSTLVQKSAFQEQLLGQLSDLSALSSKPIGTAAPPRWIPNFSWKMVGFTTSTTRTNQTVYVFFCRTSLVKRINVISASDLYLWKTMRSKTFENFLFSHCKVLRADMRRLGRTSWLGDGTRIFHRTWYRIARAKQCQISLFLQSSHVISIFSSLTPLSLFEPGML